MKHCPVCAKPLKEKAVPGGGRIWACKTPTCKNFGKAPKSKSKS